MTWSEEEIETYRTIRRKELGPLYAAAGLSITEPEKRAEYLAGKLNLTMTDHDVIMREASTLSSNGKAQALKLLEDMAIEIFF